MRTASAVTECFPTSPRVAAWTQRQPPSPLTTDQHQPFRVPSEESDCDSMLALAESRVKYLPEAVRQELLVDLARFLGATSRVWTRERRARLEAVFVDAGLLAVGPVLGSVVATPREEVVDDAVSALASIVEKHENAAVAFEDALTPPPSGAAAAPIAREVMLRALVRGQCTEAADAKLRVAYLLARADVSPAVREAAVQALSTIGRRDGAAIVQDLLNRLRPEEADALVIEAIDDALDAVRDR